MGTKCIQRFFPVVNWASTAKWINGMIYSEGNSNAIQPPCQSLSATWMNDFLVYPQPRPVYTGPLHRKVTLHHSDRMGKVARMGRHSSTFRWNISKSRITFELTLKNVSSGQSIYLDCIGRLSPRYMEMWAGGSVLGPTQPLLFKVWKRNKVFIMHCLFYNETAFIIKYCKCDC